MQHSEALIIIAKIQAIWPKDEMSEPTIREYATSIEHLSPAVAAMTLEALKVECKWKPSVAEFLQRAAIVVPPDRIPDIDEAWAEVREQIRRVGSKRGMLNFATNEPWEPMWSHPLVGRIVDNIGWKALCESDNEVAYRAHFIRMYEPRIVEGRREQAMTPQGKALMEAILRENQALNKGVDDDS